GPGAPAGAGPSAPAGPGPSAPAPAGPGPSAPAPAGLGLLVVATVLIGLNLRGPIVGIPPLIDEISADLGLTATTAGLITSLPLVCFAVGSPFVALLARRFGLERTLLVALLLLGAAIALRPWDGLAPLLTGTVVVGAAITVGNVLVPVLVRRDGGRHVKSIMAASTSSYGVGGALAAAVAVPMAAQIGWRGATASLAVLVAVALVVWLVHMRSRRTRARAQPPVPRGTPPAPAAGTGPASSSAHRPSAWTQASAWWLAAFFGLQATLFYSVSAWLPPLLVQSASTSAATGGTAVSLFHLLGIAGTLAVPAMIRWFTDARRVGVVIAIGWLVLLVGVLVLPHLWLPWVLVGGIAQGAGIGLGLTLVAERPVDADYGRSVSAMVQGAGYALAALGPIVIGWAHSATDSWVVPLTILVGLAIGLGVSGLRAGEDRPIGGPAHG
ncbi:MFS transporter, partial [Georgenia thermotolerans]|uniref:MFS transporter n=1 Tax=Georgenia thermotolerans TaxID=527326 RepID=UPI001B8CCAE6